MAMRALIFNKSRITANRIAIHWMVYGKIPHIGIMHSTDNALKRLDVLRRVTIHLDIGDMTSILECMVWRLNANLVDSLDGVINRHMRGIRHVRPVRNTFDYPIILAVAALELACRRLSRRAECRPVHMLIFRIFIGSRPQMADNLEPKLLCLSTLAVMLADERLKALGQTTEADGIRRMLENILDALVTWDEEDEEE